MNKKSAVEHYHLEVTDGTEADLPTIRALAHEIWPICYVGVLTDEQIDNMLTQIYSLENLKQEMVDGHRFWVAFVNNKPVGFASAYKKDGDIFLRKLYVHPDQQDAGIGSRLLKTTAKELQPAENIKLFVNNRNIAAHSYYERRGFVKIGTTPVKMGDFDFNDYIYSCPAKILL